MVSGHDPAVGAVSRQDFLFVGGCGWQSLTLLLGPVLAGHRNLLGEVVVRALSEIVTGKKGHRRAHDDLAKEIAMAGKDWAEKHWFVGDFLLY
jgi:hypothetical protein